ALGDHGVVQRHGRRALQHALHRALAVAGCERLALRPGGERLTGLPGAVADVLARLVAPQEQEVEEPGYLVQVALPFSPHLLEGLTLALGHLEAVHRDKHRASSVHASFDLSV